MALHIINIEIQKINLLNRHEIKTISYSKSWRWGIVKILRLATLIIIIFYFIKYDITNGTLTLASFYNQQNDACIKQELSLKMNSIAIQTVKDDTIYTLFSLYADDKVSFIDRLSDFYRLNPHLKKQQFNESETVLLPIYEYDYGKCK